MSQQPYCIVCNGSLLLVQYGGEAVDTGGEWRNTCWSRTSPPALGHKSCVVAALIAQGVTCSDFRLASHVSHSRTERHLPLASQHAVVADVSRSCKSGPGPLHRRERAYAGKSKHESGPHRCPPQLLSLHQHMPPRATSRERVQLT